MTNKIMRQVIFTNKDNSLVRTQLRLPGGLLSPPLLLSFNGKIYRNTGSGLECNFYREVLDTYMVIEDL